MEIDNRTRKRKLGDLGEEIACKYLERKGFQIIKRNYLKKYGEIDIIAQTKKELRFIEVKSVSCEINTAKSIDNQYRPEENVHQWKIQRLKNTVEIYLLEKHVSPETEWGIDLITVQIDENKLISRVNLMRNII